MMETGRRCWIAGALSLAGSAAAFPPSSRAGQPPVRETVLRPGESITATNKFGTIRISYVSDRERKFEFDGHTATRRLISRSDRFMGMLGLYDPADSWNFAPSKYRLIVEEADIYFDNYDDIYAKLHAGSEVMDWVYTADGLVIGYSIARPKKPGQFDAYAVDIFQFFVGAEKPVGLRGARDHNVKLGSA